MSDMSLTVATWALSVVTLGLLVANGIFIFITWRGITEAKRPFFILSPTKNDLDIFVCIKNVGSGIAKNLEWSIESIESKSEVETFWDKGKQEYVGIMDDYFLKIIRADDYVNKYIWEKERIKLRYEDIFGRKFTQVIKLNFHETPTFDFVKRNYKWLYVEGNIKIKEKLKEETERLFEKNRK